MTATGRSTRARSELPGITFRPAVEADLPECGRIHQEGIDGYLVPLGFPPLPRENQGLLRLHAHTPATSPDRFIVAERQKRLGAVADRGVRLGGRSRARCGSCRCCSWSRASRRAGSARALLDRLLPGERDGRVLATCTDSAQPISNGLYAALGIVPRMPLFNLVGRPHDRLAARAAARRRHRRRASSPARTARSTPPAGRARRVRSVDPRAWRTRRTTRYDLDERAVAVRVPRWLRAARGLRLHGRGRPDRADRGRRRGAAGARSSATC